MSSAADRQRRRRSLIDRGADDLVKRSVQREACERDDPYRYQGISRRRQDVGRIADERRAEIELGHGITPGSENYRGMNLTTRRAPNGWLVVRSLHPPSIALSASRAGATGLVAL